MRQALEGVRVLDLSRLLPGPYASMMLGDLGAEVIKIEDTGAGDPTRYMPPIAGDEGAIFLQVNRNKRSIAIDLKKPEGRDLFLKLAARSDCILEQFRPGVVERLGIGYAEVSAVNPQLVYCSLTGYGQTGPYRERAGHDINYIALAGVLGLTVSGGGIPAIPGVQLADLAGGMAAAFSILAALIARGRTGRGQYIDVAMFDVMLSMLPIPASYEFTGNRLAVGDKYVLSGAYPFYNVYPTADEKFMSLGALEPKFWQNFCKRVGREDLIARQFDEGAGREQLFEELRGIFKSRTQAEWVALMRDADACCEPVLSPGEAFTHGQSLARMGVQQLEGAIPGQADQLGFAHRMSDTPARVTRRPPGLGEHTDEILASLNIPQAERERLEGAGVIRRGLSAGESD